MNVACATPVSATQDNEFSLSTSILSNAGRLGDEEPVDAVTPDVTGETILRDLGMVVPVGTPSERLFCQLRGTGVGGVGSSVGSASLGNFASPTRVTQEGGIQDRNFTGQARSSFASVEDMPFSHGMNDAVRSSVVDMSARVDMNDDMVSKRGLVMGSQLGFQEARFVNTSPGPFGSGTVVDEMAQASSSSMFGRDVMLGNRNMLGNLFDDFVRIPRSEYDELRLCKAKAEELLSVVLQMENHIKNKEVELVSTQQRCAEVCDHVRNECVQKIEQVSIQLKNECRRVVMENDQAHLHVVRTLEAEYEKRCVEYEHRIKLYESRISMLGEQVSRASLVTHAHTQVFDMDVDPMHTDGFKSVGTDSLSGKLGHVMTRVSNMFTNRQQQHDNTAVSSGSTAVYPEAPSFTGPSPIFEARGPSPAVTGCIHRGSRGGQDDAHVHTHAHDHVHTRSHVHDGVPNVTGCIHQGGRDSRNDNMFSSPCQVPHSRVVGTFDSDPPNVTGCIHQGFGDSRTHVLHTSSPCQATHSHANDGRPNVTGCIHQGSGESHTSHSHVPSRQAVPTLGPPVFTGRIHQGNGGAMNADMTTTMYAGSGIGDAPNVTGCIHQGIGGAGRSISGPSAASHEHGMNKAESEKSLIFKPSDVTGRIHQGTGGQDTSYVHHESFGNYMHVSRPVSYDEAFQTLQRNLAHDSTGRIHQGLVNENSMKADLSSQGLVNPSITGRIHQGTRNDMDMNVHAQSHSHVLNSDPNLTGRIHQGFGVGMNNAGSSGSHDDHLRHSSHVHSHAPLLPAQACQNAGTSNSAAPGHVHSGIPQDPFHMNAQGVQSGNVNSVNNTPNRGRSGPPSQPPPTPPSGHSGHGLQEDDDVRPSGSASGDRRPSGAGDGGSGPPGGDPPAAAGTVDPSDDVPVGGGSGYDFIGGRRVVVGNIELDPMPDPGRLRQWKIDLVERVADACPHGFAWIRELDNCTSIEDVKALPLSYPALEAKLATAVKKSIKKSDVFLSKMTRLIEVGHQSGVRVTRREIVPHVCLLEAKCQG